MTTLTGQTALLTEPAARGRRVPRLALPLLLAATAVLYLWGLGASGWANAFYSAAVQAGSSSWQAMFFGSSDAANLITVDKTPLALWPMDLSARIFGVNSWSILIPQALEGVGTVAVLHATVRRSLRAAVGEAAAGWAGLLAGAMLALTPIATLMFRFNNPDALLVLMLTLGAYGLVRAQESGQTRWLVLAGAAVGCGFMAKMLQAFLILPGFALVYLVLAGVPFWRRVRQVLWAGLAMVVAAGWWVAVVAMVPAADRPYIGGSQHNSVLELAFGYNGFGRLTGDETGGLGNTNQDAGLSRLFDDSLGGQICWLLPAALLLAVGVLWALRRAPRTDTARAAALVWLGWLLVTGAVFSVMQGIFHPYYTVALAPAVAALAGGGAVLLWLRGGRYWVAAAVLLSGVWSYQLLGRTPDFQPWLRPVVLGGAVVAAVALALGSRLPARLGLVAAGTGAVVVLAGPAAYSVQTASTGHTGAIPSAGPSAGGFPGGGGFGGRGGFGGQNGQNGRNGAQGAGGLGFPGGAGMPGGGAGGGGGMALLDASTPSAAMTGLLTAGAGAYTWVAATVGSNSAAGYQLAAGRPVMAIGGFNGTDPAPTLAKFQQYVAAGRVHYFVGTGMSTGGGGGSAGSDAQQIVSWVQQHYPATTVGGTTVYDLTKAKPAG